MRKYKRILSSLVRSLVRNPQEVFVRELNPDPLAFETQVAHADYEPVLCKLSSLKSLAAACSDLPEQTRVFVYLKPQ